MDEVPDADTLWRLATAAGTSFVEAIREGDPGAAAMAYTSDARLVAPSAALIEGRAGIESFWRAGIDAGIRVVDRVPLRIDGHGSAAFEFGRYTIRLRSPERGWIVDRGNYLLVHERDGDGAWRWAIEMFTPDGAPQVASDAPAAGCEEVATD
jgi:ketosteroid isomerase-like protein